MVHVGSPLISLYDCGDLKCELSGAIHVQIAYAITVHSVSETESLRVNSLLLAPRMTTAFIQNTGKLVKGAFIQNTG